MSRVAKRSYGTGRLYVVVDRGGRASWYGSWWAGGSRVKRKIGLKRSLGTADGLTRTMAERELRRLVDATTVVARGQRRTIGEAGDAYVAHLENVMERKRTTIADYRGYLRRHLAPFFADRPMDRVEAAEVERYLHAKRGAGLSAKTVQNHLNFLRDRPRARERARPDVPRAAPHVRNTDGRGRRAAARDPGVDGPRRREHDRDLRALCARPDRRCGVCATCVRLGHGRAGPARRCGFGDAAPRQAPVGEPAPQARRPAGVTATLGRHPYGQKVGTLRCRVACDPAVRSRVVVPLIPGECESAGR